MATSANASFRGLGSPEDRAAALDALNAATFSVWPTTGGITMRVVTADFAEARGLTLLLGAVCRRDESAGWTVALGHRTLFAVMDEVVDDLDDAARARWYAAVNRSGVCVTRRAAAHDADPAAVLAALNDTSAMFGTVKNSDGTRRLRLRVYRDDVREARDIAALFGADVRRCSPQIRRFVVTVEGACASTLVDKVRDHLDTEVAARLGYVEATIAESRTAAAIAAA